MSWLVCMLVYLSINGQVTATPIHLDHCVAKISVSSISSSASLKINQHYVTNKISTSGEMLIHKKMESCQCVECGCTPKCECTSSRAAQTSSLLIYSNAIVEFSTRTEQATANTDLQLISPLLQSLYRPPISS